MKKLKRIISVMMCFLLIAVNGTGVVMAAQPISMALELETQKLGKGDSTQVVVSLQNYNDEYKDNVITTIVMEVKFDTAKLEVDKKSVKMLFNKGDGMGFGTARQMDDKVELQYVNVADPLAKGTKELYCFTVTAKEEVANLLDALSIARVVFQDGTLAVSEKLPVVPVALVNGEAVELETEDETTAAPEQNGSTGNSGSVNSSGTTNSGGNQEKPSGSGSSEETEEITTKWNNSQENGNLDNNTEGIGNNDAQTKPSSENTKETEAESMDNKENTVNKQNETGESADVEGTEKENTDDTKEAGEKNEAQRDQKGEHKTGKFILCGVAIIVGAVGGFLVFKKKKSTKQQK